MWKQKKKNREEKLNGILKKICYNQFMTSLKELFPWLLVVAYEKQVAFDFCPGVPGILKVSYIPKIT